MLFFLSNLVFPPLLLESYLKQRAAQLTHNLGAGRHRCVRAPTKQITPRAAAGLLTSKVTSQHGESLSSVEINEVAVVVAVMYKKK